MAVSDIVDRTMATGEEAVDGDKKQWEPEERHVAWLKANRECGDIRVLVAGIDSWESLGNIKKIMLLCRAFPELGIPFGVDVISWMIPGDEALQKLAYEECRPQLLATPEFVRSLRADRERGEMTFASLTERISTELGPIDRLFAYDLMRRVCPEISKDVTRTASEWVGFGGTKSDAEASADFDGWLAAWTPVAGRRSV